ncbi:hypothetical protein CR513_30772, partial [Mucuna pruriens]
MLCKEKLVTTWIDEMMHIVNTRTNRQALMCWNTCLITHSTRNNKDLYQKRHKDKYLMRTKQ